MNNIHCGKEAMCKNAGLDGFYTCGVRLAAGSGICQRMIDCPAGQHYNPINAFSAVSYKLQGGCKYLKEREDFSSRNSTYTENNLPPKMNVPEEYIEELLS